MATGPFSERELVDVEAFNFFPSANSSLRGAGAVHLPEAPPAAPMAVQHKGDDKPDEQRLLGNDGNTAASASDCHPITRILVATRAQRLNDIIRRTLLTCF